MNTSPLFTVQDAHTRAALPGVSVSSTNAMGATTSTVFTNGLGQFLLLAPPAPALGLYTQFPAYAPLLTTYNNTASGVPLTIPFINLTGDGVVAGRVVTEPSNAPLYDVQVSVCPPTNPSCQNFGFTNETGIFWVAATPGLDVVTIDTQAYLTNVTAVLTVVTDRWSWVGTVPVYEFAGVTGTIRGLPSGDLLVGANVSVCSPFGTPAGPCGITVPTDANGTFLIPTPPSTYILEFQAIGYNTSYLPITLFPGENLSIGTEFLFADGVIAGDVISAFSGTPISNATVFACAEYAATLCSAFLHASSFGTFELTAPPGPDLLTATAPGFFDNYSAVYVPTGETTTPITIALLPLSLAIPESIAGSVVAANRSGAPLPGAFLSAERQGVPTASAATDAAGHFFLALPWGTYSVLASDPGYASVRRTLTVHANLTDLLFALPTMTYTVSGTVRDGTSGASLNAVAIDENGTPLATTASSGAYSFSVPNGTYSLVASATGATAGAYADLPFAITVSGRSVQRDIQLSPNVNGLSGLV
ncbi:MAG: carboxypeptidase regulatory-like domain-containing protein, partial [Thermoplasmata archaeon]|nr:carboxypeptidase regulatory-like domain-containing protein [Thermoplasmata archaeon]